MDKTASIAGKKYEYVSAEIHEYSPELTEKEKAAAAFYVLMAEEFGKGRKPRGRNMGVEVHRPEDFIRAGPASRCSA